MDWKTSIKDVNIFLHWRIIIYIIMGGMLGFFLGLNFVIEIDRVIVAWTGIVFGSFSGLVIGSIWQLKDKNRRKQTSGVLIVIPALGWLFMGFLGIININSAKVSFVDKVEFMNELKQIINEIPSEITILPYQLSGKEFEYSITSPKDLNKFYKGVQVADTQSVSGHSGPIYECTIMIKTKSGNFSYLGSVHKYDKRDFFISDGYYYKTGDKSYRKWDGSQIRIPNLGAWIMDISPNGKL